MTPIGGVISPYLYLVDAHLLGITARRTPDLFDWARGEEHPSNKLQKCNLGAAFCGDMMRGVVIFCWLIFLKYQISNTNPVNQHSPGIWTIWRCISYRKNGDFPVSHVKPYQRRTENPCDFRQCWEQRIRDKSSCCVPLWRMNYDLRLDPKVGWSIASFKIWKPKWWTYHRNRVYKNIYIYIYVHLNIYMAYLSCRILCRNSFLLIFDTKTFRSWSTIPSAVLGFFGDVCCCLESYQVKEVKLTCFFS